MFELSLNNIEQKLSKLRRDIVKICVVWGLLFLAMSLKFKLCGKVELQLKKFLKSLIFSNTPLDSYNFLLKNFFKKL